MDFKKEIKSLAGQVIVASEDFDKITAAFSRASGSPVELSVLLDQDEQARELLSWQNMLIRGLRNLAASPDGNAPL